MQEEIPRVKKLQEQNNQQYEEEFEEDYETPEEPTVKKKETHTELTEEMVIRSIENLSYRIGRIEHHLRLDY